MKIILALSVLMFARASLASDVDKSKDLAALKAIRESEPPFNPDTDVYFVLFTRRNPTIGQRLASTNESIISSQWKNKALGTRFIVHGWTKNLSSPVNVLITRAFLAAGDYNVVAVDWSAGNSVDYLVSHNLIPAIATVIARFIDFLHLTGFLVNFNCLNIVGHSLGAHIAGVTGKRVTRGLVQTIFGLDPAGPHFNLDDAAGRFAVGDAVYTEMIATNAGELGFDQPIADASFYPNWGTTQPGCNGESCSHGRAVDYYAESIKGSRFVARRCGSYAQITSRNCPAGQGTETMGGNADRNLSGVFFLETNAVAPFARG